jgi:hypothetical protein
MVFTEQGVVMLFGILNSERATSILRIRLQKVSAGDSVKAVFRAVSQETKRNLSL